LIPKILLERGPSWQLICLAPIPNHQTIRSAPKSKNISLLFHQG